MMNPCKDCQEREAGCHTRCPDGIEQDRQERDRRDKIRAAKAREVDYSEFKSYAVERTKRIVGR